MYSKEDIKRQLEKIGAERDMLVTVHISLRSVGEVEGGGEGLLDAMIEYFDRGLLVIPTHTWKNLGKDKITLDMTSPWSNLGAFSIISASDTRGIRSENPTHSVVVFGDRSRALDFIGDEGKINTPTAPEGCYGKMYLGGGKVLLIGVSHNSNTFLHCVDEILKTENRMGNKPIKTTVKSDTGEISERQIYLYDTDYTDDISRRFHKFETAFRYRGAVNDGWIGDAPAQLCDCVGMKETVELIYERAEGFDPLSDERQLLPRWYVR